MTDLLLISPILIAILPGWWSFGHMRRMFWTLMALLLLPVLLIIPGAMILKALGMAWRCAVWRWCGLCSLAGIVVLFIWAVGYLWREIPMERWNILLAWLCRLVILAVIGALCAAFTLFGSFFVVLLADSDLTAERDGQTVVVQYLWNDGSNYYAYYGPFVCGTELLEGSADLMR